MCASAGILIPFNQIRYEHPHHVVTDFVSFVRAFLLKNPSLTHAVIPPFRNRSRSSRLFGCKRPHNGFVSLPPCFGFYFSITYTFNNYRVSFSIINSLYIVASYISLAAIFLSLRTNYNIVVGATCGRLPIHSKLKTGEYSSPLR